jgi:hypothetical protein
MKKIYALLMLCLPMLGFAQTSHDVTFKVNTANITVGPNGLYLGGGIIGGANAVQLTDPDGNGVYEGTHTLTGAGGGKFIFLNSPANANDYGTKENLAGLPCGDPAAFNDRTLPSFTQDTTLLFCFGTCANDTVCPAPQADYQVTFMVNTANITVGPNGIYAGGGILGNARGLKLDDADGDGIYTGDTVITGQGGGNFIFLNSPSFDTDWNTKEGLVGLPCGDPLNFNDRIMPSFGQDTTLMFCFGTCSTDTVCPTPPVPVDVTFVLDLSGHPNDSAFIRGGTINNWASPGLPMSDDDGDNVWEITLSRMSGEAIEYKYNKGTSAGSTEESLDPATNDSTCTLTSGIYTNRLLMTSANDSILPVNCWEECGPCANIGIEEEAASFIVKPNPASDVLFIENTTGTTSKVAVYGITGARVMEATFDAETRLDVASLPRGMYIVRVQNGMTEKVVRVVLN